MFPIRRRSRDHPTVGIIKAQRRRTGPGSGFASPKFEEVFVGSCSARRRPPQRACLEPALVSSTSHSAHSRRLRLQKGRSKTTTVASVSGVRGIRTARGGSDRGVRKGLDGNVAADAAVAIRSGENMQGEDT